MNLEATYTAAAFWLAFVFLWVACAAFGASILRERIASSFGRVALAMLFGPVFLFVLLFKRKSILSLRGVLFASLLIFFGAMGSIFVARNWLHLSGEALQLPLASALAVFGLISGVLLAKWSGRIGFLEALFVSAFLSLIPCLPSAASSEILAEGTATAYFVALIFFAYMVSLVSLTLGGALGYLLFGDGRASISFSYESFMGRRFLMAHRSSHAVSMITMISVFAVTVGCMGMVVVMSIMNGFGDDIRKKIVGSNSHLLVLKYGPDFTNFEDVIAKTENLPGITGASAFILNEVMISSDVNLSGAIIKGIDVQSIGSVTDLPRNMIDGKLEHLLNPSEIPKLKKRQQIDYQGGKKASEIDMLDKAVQSASDEESQNEGLLPGLVLGQEMARNLKVFVGDVINVVSPIGELGPTGPIPRARAFRVAGVFFTGMYEYDAKFAYISLSEAQSFFGLGKSVSGVEYKTDDVEKTKWIGSGVRKALGGYPYYTKDWMQMNHSLFSALKLEKIAMFLILTVIILMASLLILVALVLVVIEKSKEIAILKSMGASDASIMKIFVTYGVMIGGFGMLIGVGCGIVACLLIQKFGIGLDAEVYYISYLPVKIEWYEIALVGVVAVIVSFLATVPPSLFAARLRPAEGLRQ